MAPCSARSKPGLFAGFRGGFRGGFLAGFLAGFFVAGFAFRFGAIGRRSGFTGAIDAGHNVLRAAPCGDRSGWTVPRRLGHIPPSPMTDPNASFESASVAAILAQRSREDRSELLDELVATLSGIVPGVQVDRALLRRHVTAVRMPLGDFVYSLKRNASGSFESSRQHAVRGVVIRTEPMELDAFLAELGPALDAELRRTEKGRDALRAWLNSTSA